MASTALGLRLAAAAIFLATGGIQQSVLADKAYPGCEPPPTATLGRTFYVDPARGSHANDGSAERPWRTLAEVLDPKRSLVSTHLSKRERDHALSLHRINPNGLIRPGDQIVLMSGEHGDVVITGLRNEKFISIVAGPGQTPVIRQMTINGASRWAFRDIKFQGERRTEDKARAVVHLGASNWLGDTDQIAIEGGSVSTVEDARDWSKEDWVQKASVGLLSAATCLSVVGTRFFHLRNALHFTGSRTFVSGNLFESNGNDAIQLVASDATIVGNRIRDGRHSPAEPLHADAIQGWTQPGRVNRNILIARNWIENLNPPDDNYLQGITIFDGEWDGIRIENNVVLVNHWHGITLLGVNNAVVINNTVISTQPDLFKTWIMVREAKTKRPSKDVQIRNNITPILVVSAEKPQVDHNVASEHIELTLEGRRSRRTLGNDGNGNVVQRHLLEEFVSWPSVNGRMDLRPTRGSAAIRAGSSAGAPQIDYFGRRRDAPIDAGAIAR